MCGALTFDRYGRIVTVCANLAEVSIVLVDAVSLDVLTWMPLPLVSSAEGGLATAYMVLDNLDRAWVLSGDHILVVEETGEPGNTTFNIAHEYDLSAAVKGNIITAVTPDWQGRIWFITRKNGIVGVLDPATGSVQSRPLGEEIANGFGVDHNDAYIASTP
jgi:ligand-binding sensor domain-containing protein